MKNNSMQKKLLLTLTLFLVPLVSFAYPSVKLYFIEVTYYDNDEAAIGGYLLSECRENSYYSWGTTDGAVNTQTIKERCNFNPPPLDPPPQYLP